MSAPVDPSKRFTFIDKRELASVVGEAIAPAKASPSDSVTVHELYRNGLRIEAVSACAPNTVIVEPVHNPAVSEGGIIVENAKGVRGTDCLAYRVAMVGEDRPTDGIDPASFLPVAVGDVVALRNGMLEPLHPKLEPLAIHRMHLLARVDLRE